MGLEAVNFLHDLVQLNPVGALDQLHEGDDHIRNLKKALANTFPGLNGRVWRRVARPVTGDLTSTDNMTLQKAASGITLTPSSAATLGNGWMCMVRADDGAVTVDPAQNINGAASLVVPQGYTAIIFSDGAEFWAFLAHHAIPATTPAFPAGTRMVFHQTAAPAGWNKLVNAQYDNAALRMTIGTVGTGGVDAFTTHFGAGKSTSGHALAIAEIPPHNHPVNDPGHWHTDGHANNSKGNDSTDNSGSEDGSAGGTSVTGITIGNTGGGAAHAHVLPNFNIKFVDIIVAEKT